MRTTLTIDDDIARLIEQENHLHREPMKVTINRLLRSGLAQAATTIERKPFIVKPLDLGLSAEQWAQWNGKSIHEILEEVEGPGAP